MNKLIDFDQLLAYYYGLIDPSNPLDPKYAEVRRQIDSILEAKAAILATRPTSILLTESEASQFSRKSRNGAL